MAEQLKLPEVARRLGVSEKTARRYVKSGTLPSMFVGGAYRVSEEDLEGFLQSAKVTPSGGSPKAPASSQPSVNGLIEVERRLSRFSEAIIAFAARWGESVSSPDMNDRERLAIIRTALQLSDVISERVEDENWEAIPNQERLEIVTTMEQLNAVAEKGVNHLKSSAQTEAERKRFQERREQIRQWTRQISA